VGPEKAKPVTDTLTELKIYVNEETLKKLEKLRDLLAHQNPSGSYGSLIGLIAEFALDKVDPERIEARIQKRKEKAEKTSQTSLQRADAIEGTLAPLAEEIPVRKETLNPSNPKNPRYISPSIRRQIFLRDKGCCSFQDPVSGRVCESRFQVQIEHILPVALGGKNELSNCTLRCFSHNQLAAIQVFGQNAIKKHGASLR
jgi:hypothetical protein